MTTMLPHDRYGMPLSTISTAAAAYVDAVDRLLSINPGATAGFARAVELDEGFALGHAGQALNWALLRESARARPAIERAQALAGGLTRREQQHIAAVTAMVGGDLSGARRLMREHLAEFPRDALLLTALGGLVRGSGRLSWPEEHLALMDEKATNYGDDWWFLGAHSFAHHELRLFEPARRLGERSLDLYPRNAIPTHSLAHVYYETGDHAAGFGFLDGWVTNYQRGAELHGHLSWHLALFNLANGHYERAISIYDQSLRPEVTEGRNKLPDAASFLWRWLIYGLAERELPWGPVRNLAKQLTAQPGMAFFDAHAALAYAGAGDAASLEALIDGLRLLATNGNTLAGDVVVPLALGIDAFAQGDYDRTVALVEPIADQIVRIGGSHAQREVFEDTLIQAYLRAGRFERGATLLQRRLEHRHSARDRAWLELVPAGTGELT